MKKLIDWFKKKLENKKKQKAITKKLEELRKRDPFVYKSF
jgi:hypothetical protein